MEKIMQGRMDRGFMKYQKEFEEKALEVLRSGWYILGKEVEAFEEEFAAYVGSKYSVGLASGLDALWLAFKVLGIGEGDEVLVQGNTYIASVMGITINGATPVFIDPDECHQMDVSKIEEKITDKTKAILVVHLYGTPARMDVICDICKKHNLKLVEDCAQSHGAKFGDKMTGTFGDIGCFSFYPSKNMGAFGDAGAITTDDPEIARMMKIYRNYGSQKRYYNMVVGANSRLDEMQAGLLRVRLSHMDEITKERVALAKVYDEGINNPKLIKPITHPGTTSVYHQYVLRVPEKRDEFKSYLEEHDIMTLIHYPVPPHMQECYQYLEVKEGSLPVSEQFAKEVISLPIYSGMTKEEQQRVIDCINSF